MPLDKQQQQNEEEKGRDGVTVTLQTPSTDTPTYTDPLVAETNRYLSAFREEAEAPRKKI